MSYKGKFKPRNPAKYKGDPTKIIYRSLWEKKVFHDCDTHPDVLWWQSEEISVLYRVEWEPPNKTHRYYPDIVLCKKAGDGKTETLMIEIKPHAQTKEPNIAKKNNTPTGRVSRRYLNEVKTFGVNSAKWKAAEQFCLARGWKFVIMTEKDIF